MSIIDALRHRLRTALRPNTADRERDEEYAFHQSLAAQQLRHEGATPDDARLAARRAFGNVSLLREEARWMGITRWLDTTAQDLRYGWRGLRRSPAFTLVAVLSLAVGIGANAVIFGLIHSLVLARLPVANPGALRLVSHAPDGPERAYFTSREAEALRSNPNVDLAALRTNGVQRIEVGGTTINSVTLDAVDGSFFRLVGVGHAAGRLITDSDVRSASTVVVVSHRFATARLGSASAAPGMVIELNDVPFTIIGVTDARYDGLTPDSPYSIAIPFTTLPLLQRRPANDAARDVLLLTRVGADSARVQSALQTTFGACCAQELASRSAGPEALRIGFIDISHGIIEGKRSNVREQYAKALFAVMGGVAVLLLITCTNVGNLLLARATQRSRELAVRLSLGASRGRIVRQLLVEAALLAMIGATGGVMLAVWGSALLARHLPTSLGMLEPFVAIRPGLPIFGFTAGVAVVCILVFGILPAIRATAGNLTASLRETHGTARRTRPFDRGLVAIQVGLALLLVSSSGLLVATLRNLTSAAGGSDPETLIAVQLDVRGTSHSDTALQAIVPVLQRQFEATPGIRSVAESYAVPLIYGGLPTRPLDVRGAEQLPEHEVTVATIEVGTGFFSTLGIRLIAGRDFNNQDRRGSPRVAVISENLARRFFGDRNPIGEQIGFRGGSRDMQIVGVVEDAKHTDLRTPSPWTVYLPSAQSSYVGDRAVFAVRTSVNPTQVIPALRATILRELPNVRIRHLHPMTELLALTVGREQALVFLSVTFGVLAVALAAIGLYGVIAFHVSARTREIGVRIALGARRSHVVRMVVRQALRLVTMGVVIGVPLALAGARSLRALLYGIGPFNPVPVAAAAGVLIVVGLLAALLPSRRAARIDPLTAIRAE